MSGYASAIGSHVGMVRSNNQDSGYAGYRLFLVADGMGGHAGGDVASALTAQAMARVDAPLAPPHDTGPGEPRASEDPAGGPANPALEDPKSAAELLRKQLLQTNRMLRSTVGDRPELAGMGTTFSGFITVEDRLALAHIGDSRLYLLRDGAFTQITKDHTFVQRLVDSGRITEEEAKTHPRRSVLMRVLGDVESQPEIDTAVLETRPGDVWLLCSDGLCGYVEDEDIERILRRRTSLQGAVDSLIDKSLAHGAPDNVTVVLVETLAEPDQADEPAGPRFAGSAANEVPGGEPVSTARTRLLSRRRISRRAQPVAESHFEPRVDEYLKELIAETKRRNRRRRILGALALLAIIAAIAGALTLGYQWTQTRYFVGTDGETVIIFRGVQQNIGSISLSSIAEDTEIPLSALDGNEQRQVQRTLSAGSLEEARDIVTRLGVHE
ncbi:PP2C family protein-serine/threonine phosphatase [Leucobacter soli]|uniref:PP2C-family Ser/Thr phosphatase n=1 Tax=Leucobacter soli TaxID=2812850 RepID=A0A916JYK8_9MICO|nr:PP2C family serine/threonine-protein phosphatase [Leucobacter soli]CAG7608005.1 PP2C-family Ser/Thr phosphatase [Leucobacter soli]